MLKKKQTENEKYVLIFQCLSLPNSIPDALLPQCVHTKKATFSGQKI